MLTPVLVRRLCLVAVIALVSSGCATYIGRARRSYAEGRYLEALPLPGGGTRLFWEARRGDGSHELRTDLVAAGQGRGAA